jgi:uncharacterized protein with PIN domain
MEKRKDSKKGAEVHFLLDDMMKKTARWMRILGIDADHIEKVSDDVVLERAQKTKRLLLTMDVPLYRRCFKREIPCLLVPAGSAPEQIAFVLAHHPARITFPKKTLCPQCNGELGRVPKAKVKDKVFPRVYARHRVFWLCRNKKCGKIYWEGTHWQRIRKVADEVKKLLKKQTKNP